MPVTTQENFSVVIPTYCEAKNIPELVKRIAGVDFANREFEVILADDNSLDGTVDVVKTLSAQYPWLKLFTRKQPRDLSRSILDGFSEARYPVLITMDADLSHPPEKIPELLEALAEPGVDVVIGSRYIKGGSTDPSWPYSRVLTSKLGALLAQHLLPGKVKDSLSGFLAIRKTTLQSGAPFNPLGWKIGLEIMVKCRCQNIKEIPIHFSERQKGSSNLTLRISGLYLLHVLALWRYKYFSI